MRKCEYLLLLKCGALVFASLSIPQSAHNYSISLLFLLPQQKHTLKGHIYCLYVERLTVLNRGQSDSRPLCKMVFVYTNERRSAYRHAFSQWCHCVNQNGFGFNCTLCICYLQQIIVARGLTFNQSHSATKFSQNRLKSTRYPAIEQKIKHDTMFV